MKDSIYKLLLKAKGKKKLLVVLVDPDKFNKELIAQCTKNKVDLLFVGGSKLEKGNFKSIVAQIKKITSIPTVIFPGDFSTHLSKQADALLIPSLLSGRNPDYLIGKHVQAMPSILKLNIETISTGYILCGNHQKSSTSKVTHTLPIPFSKADTILHTSLAAEMLGMKLLYLEAGSGSDKTIPSELIKKVRNVVSLPLIVGGGIKSGQEAKRIALAGADAIVVGNALEKNIFLLEEIAKTIKAL